MELKKKADKHKKFYFEKKQKAKNTNSQQSKCLLKGQQQKQFNNVINRAVIAMYVSYVRVDYNHAVALST